MKTLIAILFALLSTPLLAQVADPEATPADNPRLDKTEVKTDKKAQKQAEKDAKKASKIRKTPKAEQRNKMTVYMFGFSNEFGDSTHIITDIIRVDSADVYTKTKFLNYRDSYGYQMKTYVEGTLGYTNQTVAIFFDTKLKAIQKRHDKLKKKYLAQDAVKLISVSKDDFSFETLNLD